jgi:hypothetical protein
VSGTSSTTEAEIPLLYLDQNYLSGIVKRKPGSRQLEPVLRAALARGAVAIPEAEAHRVESAPRPDLPLLELLHELSRGQRLPERLGTRERDVDRRLIAALEHGSLPSSSATFRSGAAAQATRSTSRRSHSRSRAADS